MWHFVGYWIHRVNDKFHTPGNITKRYRVVDHFAGWLYSK